MALDWVDDGDDDVAAGLSLAAIDCERVIAAELAARFAVGNVCEIEKG